MDFLGDLLGGIGELFVFSAFTGGGNGKNSDDNSGCAIIFVVLALIGGVGMGISSCMKKPEEIPPPAPIVQKVEEVKKKETISHWMGRKTKDSVIEFGKGVIGK